MQIADLQGFQGLVSQGLQGSMGLSCQVRPQAHPEMSTCSDHTPETEREKREETKLMLNFWLPMSLQALLSSSSFSVYTQHDKGVCPGDNSRFNNHYTGGIQGGLFKFNCQVGVSKECVQVKLPQTISRIP